MVPLDHGSKWFNHIVDYIQLQLLITNYKSTIIIRNVKLVEYNIFFKRDTSLSKNETDSNPYVVFIPKNLTQSYRQSGEAKKLCCHPLGNQNATADSIDQITILADAL